MKALVITRFGGPEVLELQQVPDPQPTSDQVLVKVEAGGLNFADLMTAQGGYANTPNPPLTAGREFAGRECTNNAPGGAPNHGLHAVGCLRGKNRGSSQPGLACPGKLECRTGRRLSRKFLYRLLRISGKPVCCNSPEPAC